MRRDIAFLEKTARAVPDRDHTYRGIGVCLVSIAGKFEYFRTNSHCATVPLSRSEAERLLAEAQG